jgi:phosphate transport system permease protein
MDGAVVALTPSPRNKGFAALDQNGGMGLFHSTSHRVLWTGQAQVPRPAALSFSPKADGLILTGPDQVADLDFHNPHPEISIRALLGKVWYEGYEEPDLTWQSSSGTDDFEPKLSLVPLLVGSLKGTFYSLFLAIPLGVLGAMYASQFMHPSLRGVVKPAVEVMAALPSVVLGFLAGLWLAPRLEEVLGSMILLAFALPATAILTGLLFSQMPARIRNRIPVGMEAILTIVTLAIAGYVCMRLTVPFEQLLFGGPMKIWITETVGLPFDQRNAVVVGLGMGFAVIPIIFSVAEDAFTNVPRHLVAGSLALGANRWQTVTRVVLPTASPGVFSAIIIGFGRAVGETMIVLMATGNTPIMDWNPFNGFRTLSANIAVEIPEAPHGGTLYRTLFLAALLLFILTFAVNTVAELVRTHLRKRYANL